MSTLKPNRFNQAQNQLKNKKGIIVPSKIKAIEKNYYHILLVKTIANNEKEIFENRSITHVVNEESYEKCKKRFKLQGYSEVVIFHDPTEERLKEQAKKVAEVNKIDEAKSELEDVELKLIERRKELASIQDKLKESEAKVKPKKEEPKKVEPKK